MLTLVLCLPACGGGESADSPETAGVPVTALTKADRPKTDAKNRAAAKDKNGLTMDGSSIEDRQREGVALAVADPLKPELAGALPPGFPADIPLGNWLSITMVRRLSETDFVLSCSSSYNRSAVGEFFVRQMPMQGWKLVSSSSKPILSVFTFRKDERAVTVMVKKQAMNQDVAFDLSYKEK
jgi:hypothetical protein